MADEQLPKMFLLRTAGGKITIKKAGRNSTKAPSAFLKDFDIHVPTGTWEMTAQARSKWRDLINKRAALYEGKIICEAEGKRSERKARTNGPLADSMTLTCSTCNRQFRATELA